MKLKIGVVGLLLVFAVCFASAEVFISSQPEGVYSLGEDLEFTLGTDGTSGWAEVNLNCENSSKLVYYHYLNEEVTSYDVVVPLTQSFLRGLGGECHLNLKFGEEIRESMGFEITNKINIDLILDKVEFHPNETIVFSGSVSKQNSMDIEGVAEVSIMGTELIIIVPIENNKFEGEILLPNSVASGSLGLRTFVYEKNKDEEITNFGEHIINITVSQVATSLEVEIVGVAKPGEDLEFKAILLDQSGETMDSSQVAFIIVDSNLVEVVNLLSASGDSNYYKLRTNAVFGSWEISAESAGGLRATKRFQVETNKQAEFFLINETLIIRNVGNTNYDNFIEVTIGNESEVKNVNLSIGKSLEFLLTAPDGDYEIIVRDGEYEVSGNSFLTGSVIGVNSVGSSFNFFKKNVFAWVILIGILGTFIFVSSKRVIKRRVVLSKSKIKFSDMKRREKVISVTPAIQRDKSSVEEADHGPKGFIGKDEIKSMGAKHSLVLNGEKQNAALIALKIKNSEELKKPGSNALGNISNAIRKISDNGGKLYKTGDYIVGIFAPVITRTFDNSFNALNVAKGICEDLKDHNSKFNHKIKFGVGVNSGEIIAEKQEGKLLFTPIGQGLVDTKKIAEIAENDLLLGEAAQREIRSKARTVANPEKLGVKTYSVNEIIDRGENQKFISSFLARNREFKKLDDYKQGK